MNPSRACQQFGGRNRAEVTAPPPLDRLSLFFRKVAIRPDDGFREMRKAGPGRQRLFAAFRCSRSAACLYRAVDATRERPLSRGGDFAA